MPASTAMKSLWAKHNSPNTPSIDSPDDVNGLVTSFLFHNDLTVEMATINTGRAFWFMAFWEIELDEDGAKYHLQLYLNITQERPMNDFQIRIGRETRLWQALISASDIQETDKKVAYPPSA